MKKRFAAKIILSFLTLAVFAFSGFGVKAAESDGDVVLVTHSGNVNSPVFVNDEIAPGGSVTRTFTVKNTTDADCTIDLFSLVFDLESQNGGSISDGYSEFMHDMHISISDTDDNTVLFDGDAATLVNSSSKSCSIIVPKGGEVKFKAVAALDYAATNAVQGLSLKFNMILHCTSVDSVTAGATLNGNPKTSGAGISLVLAAMIAATVLLIVLRVRGQRT